MVDHTPCPGQNFWRLELPTRDLCALANLFVAFVFVRQQNNPKKLLTNFDEFFLEGECEISNRLLGFGSDLDHDADPDYRQL